MRDFWTTFSRLTESLTTRPSVGGLTRRMAWWSNAFIVLRSMKSHWINTTNRFLIGGLLETSSTTHHDFQLICITYSKGWICIGVICWMLNTSATWVLNIWRKQGYHPGDVLGIRTARQIEVLFVSVGSTKCLRSPTCLCRTFTKNSHVEHAILYTLYSTTVYYVVKIRKIW